MINNSGTKRSPNHQERSLKRTKRHHDKNNNNTADGISTRGKTGMDSRDVTNQSGWNNLHYAALRGDECECERILGRRGEQSSSDLLWETTPQSSSTVLHFAVLSGDVGTLSLLLDHIGIKSSSENERQRGASFLMHCSFPTTMPCSTFMIPTEESMAESFGPHEAPLRTRVGFTALDLAVLCSNTQQVELILSALEESHNRVIDIDPQSHSPITPSPQAIKSLISNDLLHAAITRGNKDIVAMLVTRGASLEQVCCGDREGMKPIHWAVACGEVEIATYLLSKGADALARTYYTNETVEDVAMRAFRGPSSVGNESSNMIMQLIAAISHNTMKES
jgi:ankyrin repeat protein